MEQQEDGYHKKISISGEEETDTNNWKGADNYETKQKNEIDPRIYSLCMYRCIRHWIGNGISGQQKNTFTSGI